VTYVGARLAHIAQDWPPLLLAGLSSITAAVVVTVGRLFYHFARASSWLTLDEVRRLEAENAELRALQPEPVEAHAERLLDLIRQMPPLETRGLLEPTGHSLCLTVWQDGANDGFVPQSVDWVAALKLLDSRERVRIVRRVDRPWHDAESRDFMYDYYYDLGPQRY
jgi:hypothetical protein